MNKMNKKGAITLISIIYTIVSLVGLVACMPLIYVLIETLMPSCPPSVQILLSMVCPLLVITLIVSNLQQGQNIGGY